jgi:hypothetical protein
MYFIVFCLPLTHILLKYVCICITTNEANVILLFILTEDAPIRVETRLRLSQKRSE